MKFIFEMNAWLSLQTTNPMQLVVNEQGIHIQAYYVLYEWKRRHKPFLPFVQLLFMKIRCQSATNENRIRRNGCRICFQKPCISILQFCEFPWFSQSHLFRLKFLIKEYQPLTQRVELIPAIWIQYFVRVMSFESSLESQIEKVHFCCSEFSDMLATPLRTD